MSFDENPPSHNRTRSVLLVFNENNVKSISLRYNENVFITLISNQKILGSSKSSVSHIFVSLKVLPPP